MEFEGVNAFFFADKSGPDSLRLLPDSPCFHAGKIVPNNGGRDFRRKPVPASTAPTIGAIQ